MTVVGNQSEPPYSSGARVIVLHMNTVRITNREGDLSPIRAEYVGLAAVPSSSTKRVYLISPNERRVVAAAARVLASECFRAVSGDVR